LDLRGKAAEIAEDADTCAVRVNKPQVGEHFGELGGRKGHEASHLRVGTFEVVEAKGVDGHNLGEGGVDGKKCEDMRKYSVWEYLRPAHT
jgi:hypothetical protein